MKKQYQQRLGNCGQTCVAMLIDREQRYVEAAVEKTGATHYGDLLPTLSVHGYIHGKVERVCRSRGMSWGMTMLCRVRMATKKYHSHWIVINDKGSVYDPAMPAVVDYATWAAVMRPAKITSYVTLNLAQGRRKPC